MHTQNSYGLLKHVIYACTIDSTSDIISANVAHLATCVTVSPISDSTFAILNNKIKKLCTTVHQGAPWTLVRWVNQFNPLRSHFSLLFATVQIVLLKTLLLSSVIIPAVRLKLPHTLLYYFLCSLWYAEGWEAALVSRRYKFIRSPLRAYWCLTIMETYMIVLRCTTPLVSILLILVEPGMPQPLSRKQPACRQGSSKIFFRTKGHLPAYSHMSL